ncbi:unnamed protein product [Fraxinus pennsylvanica]|uniref:Glycoside hydrolase family 19 catalytic domain-containing protein n=1 Tax=Fraxinus pennsylvanica TaxID=56036 RepID=A0AAD2E7I5_9LAMI|nr:unnamed protein product [Fraxinus pennsylvanica]
MYCCNYNYGSARKAIESDLLKNPDVVANDPNISFKTALWFWMTPQAPKPSCHDAISGRWTPSTADLEVERGPGYDVVTNIINGRIECGKGLNAEVEDRIGFYKRYCDLLGVGYGHNMGCYNQRPLMGTLAQGGVGSILASIYTSLLVLFVVHFAFVSYSG